MACDSGAEGPQLGPKALNLLLEPQERGVALNADRRRRERRAVGALRKPSDVGEALDAFRESGVALRLVGILQIRREDLRCLDGY